MRYYAAHYLKPVAITIVINDGECVAISLAGEGDWILRLRL
jgi:hypothetical protein